MDKESNFYKIKNNKLNIITVIISVVMVLVFGIGLLYFVKHNKEIEEILTISSDYVTICSCILVLVQLFAFVKDSRRNEARSRKESALGLAKEYAKDILNNIGFIENVLSIHYNPQDPTELKELIQKIEINKFVKTELDKKTAVHKYSKVFLNRNNDIDLNIITYRAIVSQVIDLSDLEKVPENKQKEIANVRFRIFINCTMNYLEQFAMSINQNVSESEMLYPSLHQTYLKFVKYMYPYICFHNETEEYYYTNIIKLYRKWEERRQYLEEYEEKQEKRKRRRINSVKNNSSPL